MNREVGERSAYPGAARMGVAYTTGKRSEGCLFGLYCWELL